MNFTYKMQHCEFVYKEQKIMLGLHLVLVTLLCVIYNQHRARHIALVTLNKTLVYSSGR